MLRAGEQYLEGLRDGRQVYLGDEVVTDVTTHPAFRNAARSVARLYDASSSDPDRFGYAEEDGQVHNAIWLRPRTQADLAKRRTAHDGWASVTHGLIGRSPDHVGGYLVGMACEPSVADVHGQGFGQNILDYYEFVRDRDLYVTYAVAPPGRARGPEAMVAPRPGAPASDDSGKTSALRVVKEDEHGITVWGTKILATAAVLADELLIGNLLPLSPGEEAFSVTFATPVATPGVKLIARKSFELGADPLDDPLAVRYDETDTVVFCDNVFVPWERVFSHNHLDTALALFNATPAHILGNAQAHSRLLAKMRLILGTIRAVSNLTGTAKIPAVREQLAGRATEVGVVQGLISACDATPHQWPGGYVSPHKQTMYATTAWSAEAIPGFMHGVRELLGSQPFQQAADASVFADEDAAALLVDALGSASVEDTKARYRLMKLAWDLVGSEFASRHLQYEMFYAGARHVTRARMANTFDWAVVDREVERCLAEAVSLAEADAAERGGEAGLAASARP